MIRPLYFILSAWVFFMPISANASAKLKLFNYTEEPQTDQSMIAQWLKTLERHLREDTPEGNCTNTTFNQCHLKQWLSYLNTIKSKSRIEQINLVNDYANKKTYVIDLQNYGVEDYWAIAREFLYNGGDCEDYALTKFFSLRWLGFSTDKTRIVVLQDTNLRVGHAVLAYYANDDILILDNQIEEVISHNDIVHYVPLYSTNENGWWLHLPVF
ncbi:MAG: transglutaminase-like cysteine peptidase [Gammaproteobacteria bacterium]|nr:transglutaminase-like cysteine peptidase [Gammaproteobacteria bacterium]